VANAQKKSNLRNKTITIQKDTITLDSMLILPSTVQVFHKNLLLSSQLYQINENKGLLIVSPELKKQYQNIRIKYRIFPYPINRPIYSRPYTRIHTETDIYSKRYQIKKRNNQRGIFNSSQLQKQGSYTRGISYGNNQDAVMNSNLNLQLSGKLSEDINILAAISDNNIPIQPDGNTQNINDFDRIYIKLFNKNHELTLGDYEIQSPSGYYMQFFKKVKGGKYSGLISQNKNNKLNSTFSISIAKGKFNKQEISAREGIQGPYRLHGANNEMYIIVLAGSEKVYLNGKLLKRGEKNDYTINYNTAELTFTTKQPITNNSRLIVEFEYSEENYSRYLLFNSNEFTSKNGNFYLNFFHEQDNKNSSIDQSLNDEQKLLLSKVGDQIQLAQIEKAEKVEYSNNLILYKKTIKTIQQKEYTVYEYSTDKNTTNYKVHFSFVGDKKGNYRKINSNANGKVFQWIDPINGISQGDYAPVVQLIPPQKQQMITFGGKQHLFNYINTKFELAFSNKDLNTFSSIDDEDNKGLAFQFYSDQKTFLRDTNQAFYSKVNYQYINKNFEKIENFRSVEFNRDWNIQTHDKKQNENYYSLYNSFLNQKFGSTSYEVAILKREESYKGIRQKISFDYDKNNLLLKIDGNYLKTYQDIVKTHFLRYNAKANYQFKSFILGIESENENNKWKNRNNNLLQNNSFAFNSYKVYLENNTSTKNKFKIYYQHRKDYSANKEKLKALSESHDIGGLMHLLKNRNNKLKVESVFRKFTVLQKENTDLKAENTFLGKLEHQAKIKKGLLHISTYYELGSGLESEKEFSYVKVNDGQGIYKWTDYNKNNIKELNEFEVAAFKDEANYIRVANNTQNFQKVYTSNFKQSIYLRFSKLKRYKAKFCQFLSHFSNRFAYRISKKSLSKDYNIYANPFASFSSNSNIINLQNSFQNTFSYQRSKTSWDFIHQSSKSKQLLVQGFEKRKWKQNGIRLNWKINSFSHLTNRFDIAEKDFEHEFFSNKNYKIDSYKNDFKLKFQPNLKLQLGFHYIFEKKKNKLNIEKTNSHNIGGDFQQAIGKTGKLNGSFQFIKFNYNAESNTSIAYEMLDGFLPGKNTTWKLNYNQQISKIFQINFSYNGRQNEKSKTIHVGNIEIRAYF